MIVPSWALRALLDRTISLAVGSIFNSVKCFVAVRHSILEFSARVLAPHSQQTTQIDAID